MFIRVFGGYKASHITLLPPTGGAFSPFVPLFGIDRPGIGGPWYHLVMTNALPWKDPPFLIGKPR